MRQIISFNDDWKFNKSADVVTEIPNEWGSVSLPHTWNAIDGQDGGNDYYRGTAVYVKKFNKPKVSETDRVIVSFKGVAMTADVYLNGTKVCHHEGGYSAFRSDITEVLSDENVFCVLVDNSDNEKVYPQKADFTFYGGIYRDVELIIVPQTHFELVKDGTPGIKITPIVKEDKSAVVEITAYTCGGDEVVFETLGKSVSAPVKDGKAEVLVETENPHLWDGVDDPYLYTVNAKLMAGGVTEDEISRNYGIRKMEITPDKGFILNGRVYPLRGVSRHQDFAGLGNAISIKEHKLDMDLIKEIGANTIRLAHYQHAEEFYDLCDEYGMVVWAEIPYITKHMPEGRQNTIDQMRELITQCYNHPSIACWGLSNEITASGGVTEDLLDNHRVLNELCHEMDKTRPTTMAHAFMLETDSELINIADIGSYNLYYGWYLGELSENEAFFDAYHREHPDRVIGFSEYGADTNPGLHSSKPEKGDYTEEYQCVYHEHILKCIEDRPYLWATHVWNMFDFGADGRDEGGEHGKNQKGLITIDRKIKKDAFYLYKAYWNKKDPFVHICGRRYVDRVGETTKLKVYSNLDYIALYVNGELVEQKKGNRIFEFEIAMSEKTVVCAKAMCEGNTYTDEIVINKVEKENESYRLAVSGGDVTNWFDAEGIKEGFFSINDKFGDLMANPQTGAIVGGLMQKMIASRGDVAKSTQDNKVLQKMLSGMTFASLLKQAGDAISNEQIRELNGVLQKISKAPAKVKVDLSLDTPISELLAHEEVLALFDKVLPGVRNMLAGQPAVMGFTLPKLVEFSHGRIPEAAVNALGEAISKLEIYVDADELNSKYSEDYPVTKECREIVKEGTKTSICPGKVMRDTEGKRIQAHAGQVLFEDGYYYWYGENKDRTDGESKVWTWGIRAYRSQDLYNWEDLGLIIKPEYKDKKSGLYPEALVDRPHIIKCDNTGKYVCWIKLRGDEASFLILASDKLTGPYSIVKSGYRPDGAKVGDFDIVADGGKAYLYMVAEQNGVIGYELSEDYTEACKKVSEQYTGLYAPFCREGVTVCEHEGNKYMLTSGMSGYLPNVSDYACAKAWDEKFVPVGNPHIADESHASFNSQISNIFKVQGKNLYIAVADRWCPGYILDAHKADVITRAIAAHSAPDKYSVTNDEKKILMEAPMLEGNNTSISDYVWLPVVFNEGKMEIRWYDEWKIEDFD